MTQTCRHEVCGCNNFKGAIDPGTHCKWCGAFLPEESASRGEKILKGSGWSTLVDKSATPETIKSLLKTLFPVAWKADRGRQDPELMAAYVSVQKILGLTVEDLKEMEK